MVLFCKFAAYFQNKNLLEIAIKALSNKKKVTDALAILDLPVERIVAGYQRKLLKHKKTYQNNTENQIGISCVCDFLEKVTEALAIVDSNLWYVTCLSDRCVGKCMVKSNSVSLQSSLDIVISYNRVWQNVY